jgi:hypothetical protein
MLYGAESWALTVRLESIIRSCDRRMLMYMAGVRWQDRVSNGKEASRCGLEELEVELCRRTLRWFGHVAGVEGEMCQSWLMSCKWEGDTCLGDQRGPGGGVFRRIWSLVLEKRMAQDRSKWR